jgi:hypothetical protein
MHKEVHVGPGDGRVEMDIVFPDRSLSGRVVREDTGAPVPEASVMLHLPGKRGLAGYVGSDTADDRGRFVIQLSHAGTLDLWAHARRDKSEVSGWRTNQTVNVPPEGGLQDLVVRIGPNSATVHGRVLGSNGDPLAGVRIHFEPLEFIVASDSLPLPGSTQWRSYAWTDVDGRFEYDGLSSGPWLGAVSHDRFAPLWVAGIQISRDPVDLGDLILTSGGMLEVHLPSATAADEEPCRLKLSRPGLPYPIRMTRDSLSRYRTGFEQESYVLPHFPEGTWTIDMEGAGPPQRRIVEVRTKERTVVDFSDGVEE